MLIEVEDLRFRYRGAAVDATAGLSLAVADGSLFGLLGPTGSGKTTLISLLAGLLQPLSGSIRIAGEPMPQGRAKVQARLSLVPQEYAFYPQLSVAENLQFFAGVQGVPVALRSERLDDAVETTGLADFCAQRAGRLSGGLKRRLNLAIGLLNAPRLLFLDEPTVGIDPQSRHFILEAIKAINAGGTTVVYTSHYMEEVEALCDEIAVLDAGRVIARGDLQSLLGQDGGGPVVVGLPQAPAQALGGALDSLDGVARDGAELRLAGPDMLPDILDVLSRHGVAPSRIRYGHADLEELFLQLTGHQLRD